jgi:predicted DNA-binding ribbon-helix-helix protein
MSGSERGYISFEGDVYERLQRAAGQRGLSVGQLVERAVSPALGIELRPRRFGPRVEKVADRRSYSIEVATAVFDRIEAAAAARNVSRQHLVELAVADVLGTVPPKPQSFFTVVKRAESFRRTRGARR